MKKLFTHILAVVAIAAAALMPAVSHAGVLENFAENKLVDALLRAQAIGTPATWYAALNTDACTEGAAETEVTGGSYARVAITAGLTQWAGTQSAGSTTASSGTGGTTSNNAVVTFPTSSAAWGTLTSVTLMDASTAGNEWVCIDLTSTFNVSGTGITVSFPAASLQFQIDN